MSENATKDIKKVKKEKQAIKKVFKLLRDLFFRSALVLIFIIILVLLINFIKKQTQKNTFQIAKLRGEYRSVINAINDLKTKSELTKIYIDAWTNDIPEFKKQKTGIDIQKVQNIAQKIVEKNYIKNFNMNLTVPSLIQDVNKKESIDTYYSTLTITFDAITDYSIYYFIEEFEKQVNGFIVVEKLSVTKTKDINKEFIRRIINGDLETSLNVNIIIQLYGFKAKGS